MKSKKKINKRTNLKKIILFLLITLISFSTLGKECSIRVAKIWDDFDNGIYLSDLNIYNAANDGTVLLNDIIELSSIKLRRPNGTYADVEYRVVITSQGKVRMISKFNLDNKIHLFKIKENYSIE